MDPFSGGMDPFSGGIMDNRSDTAPAVSDNLLRHDFQVIDRAMDLALETSSILNYEVRNIRSTEVSNEELHVSSLKEETWDSDYGFAPSNSIPHASIASNKQRSSYSDNQSLSKSVTVMVELNMLLFLVLLVDLKILMLVSSELVHQVSGNVLHLICHRQRSVMATTTTPIQVPFSARTASEDPCAAKTKGRLSSEASISHQIDRSDNYHATPPSLLAGINYSYETMLANADGNYHWLDRPPLGNITPHPARLIIYHLSVIYRLSCVLETS
jgi:hypothetical protein